MRTKVSLAVLAFLLGSPACQPVNGQQWKPFSERRPFTNVAAMLNKDAEAADPAGIHFYAEDLAHFLLPDGAGKKYINSFAGRLAEAERETREGKKKTIPDTQVVEAFNEIARGANLPPMPASLDWLRKLRTNPRILKEYPALLTADRNGANCYPGEAVYLLAVLLLKDAYPVPPPSPPQQRVYRPGDILPPPPPPPDPFAPLIENMVPALNGSYTAVLSSSGIDVLSLDSKRPPKVKRSRALGRHALTVLFNSAAKSLGL